MALCRTRKQDDPAVANQASTVNLPSFANSQCIEMIIVKFPELLDKVACLVKCANIPGAKSSNHFCWENRILLQALDSISGLLWHYHLTRTRFADRVNSSWGDICRFFSSISFYRDGSMPNLSPFSSRLGTGNGGVAKQEREVNRKEVTSICDRGKRGNWEKHISNSDS